MRKQQSEEGIALLIAIFVLLLIGVVAIALVVSSGTESALAGNYRSSTTVYYAAVAGLEEVRARLRPNSLNSFNNTTAPGTFLPPAGTALGVCNPVYVINPLGGEAVTPWDPANSYYDGEFSTEFPLDCGGNPPPSPSPTTQSIWNQNPLSGLPFPGPFYKWVRINGVTEKSLNLDISPYDTVVENKLLYYNGTNFTDLNNGQPQVLELTALAVLPNGSQKMVQYLVAPLAVNLPTFPAALTLLTGPGNNVTFNATTDPGTNVRGVDQDSVGSCSPSTVTPLIPAIGVSTNPDRNSVVNGVPVGARNHYTGSGLPPSPSPPPGSGPDVQIVTGSFPANLQTTAGLQGLVQTITQNADVVVTGPANGSILPGSMYSPSPNPMTIVVNGDLDLTGWSQTGYGLLLVTGNFAYSATTSWRGIILVIGQGTVTGSGAGGGDFDGVFFVANTVSGAQLGGVSMDYSAITNGEGIHYSSCWVKAATPVGNLRVLSFHEISQ